MFFELPKKPNKGYILKKNPSKLGGHEGNYSVKNVRRRTHFV
jgi:hypothetical protein